MATIHSGMKDWYDDGIFKKVQKTVDDTHYRATHYRDGRVRFQIRRPIDIDFKYFDYDQAVTCEALGDDVIIDVVLEKKGWSRY